MDKRYVRRGECQRCGWCCEQEDCEYLEYSEGIAVCSIYGHRHLRCKLYPEMPPVLHEDCGYYFEDTWEDNKIVKGKV